MTSLVLNFPGTHLVLQYLKINTHKCTHIHSRQKLFVLIETFWRSRRLFLPEMDCTEQLSHQEPEFRHTIIYAGKWVFYNASLEVFSQEWHDSCSNQDGFFSLRRRSLEVLGKRNDILRLSHFSCIHLDVWMFPCIVPTHCLAYSKRLINICEYKIQYLNNSLREIQLVPWKSNIGLWLIGNQHFFKHYLRSESLMRRSLQALKCLLLISLTVPTTPSLWPQLHSIWRVGKSREWLMLCYLVNILLISSQFISIHKSSLSFHSFLALSYTVWEIKK